MLQDSKGQGQIVLVNLKVENEYASFPSVGKRGIQLYLIQLMLFIMLNKQKMLAYLEQLIDCIMNVRITYITLMLKCHL